MRTTVKKYLESNVNAMSLTITFIISCAPFKAHTEPLMFARRILSVTDINLYMSGIFMYQCLYCSIPRLSDDFFQRNNDVHGHNTRQANDLHVPYARLDIRKFCFKVHGANIWNNTPILIRQSPYLDILKQRLRYHLIESKSIATRVSMMCKTRHLS